MAKSDIATVLDECLDDLRSGTRSIAECLEAHPELRDELEPLLILAVRIMPTPDMEIGPSLDLHARRRFVEALNSEVSRDHRRWRPWTWTLWTHRLARIAAIVLAVVMSLPLLTGGLALASQSSLPGDPLYPVKLSVEQVRVVTAFGVDGRATTRLWIADRRLEEISRALGDDNRRGAATAAESYVVAIADAGDQLQDAESAGQPVSDGLEWLAQSLERQTEVRANALAKTNRQALAALDQAREATLIARSRLLSAQGSQDEAGVTVEDSGHPDSTPGPRSLPVVEQRSPLASDADPAASTPAPESSAPAGDDRGQEAGRESDDRAAPIGSPTGESARGEGHDDPSRRSTETGERTESASGGSELPSTSAAGSDEKSGHDSKETPSPASTPKPTESGRDDDRRTATAPAPTLTQKREDGDRQDGDEQSATPTDHQASPTARPPATPTPTPARPQPSTMATSAPNAAPTSSGGESDSGSGSHDGPDDSSGSGSTRDSGSGDKEQEH